MAACCDSSRMAGFHSHPTPATGPLACRNCGYWHGTTGDANTADLCHRLTQAREDRWQRYVAGASIREAEGRW